MWGLFLMIGKCPSCKVQLFNVHLKSGQLGDPLAGPSITGFTAVCPQCEVILGVVADPVVLAADIVRRIKRG